MTAGERLADPEVRLQHARDVAWAALNRREHTEAELQRVLERKRCGPEEVATVLTELVEGGWVDDAVVRAALRRGPPQPRRLGLRAHRAPAARARRRAPPHRGRGRRSRPPRSATRRSSSCAAASPSPPEDARDRNRALGMLVRKGYELELALDVLRAYCGVGEFD